MPMSASSVVAPVRKSFTIVVEPLYEMNRTSSGRDSWQ